MPIDKEPIGQRLEQSVMRHLGPYVSISDARNYPPLNLVGRLAVVTGASDGIGKAIAETFAIHGANLVINGRNQERLEEVAEVAQAMGVRVEIARGDVALEETAQAVKSVIAERFSGRVVDILVNGAGSTKDRKMGSLRFADWRQVLETHLNGAFLMADATWESLKESGRARIISIGSISGIFGNEGQANYAAAKAGLVGLTKTWAAELAPYQGTANVLAFGPVETKIWKPLERAARMLENQNRKIRGEEPAPDDFDGLSPVKSRMLGGRFISVEEAASKALFLASELGNGITGQTIVVEAGITAMKLA